MTGDNFSDDEPRGFLGFMHDLSVAVAIAAVVVGCTVLVLSLERIGL